MVDVTKSLDFCRFIALAQVLESYDSGKKICLPLVQIMYSIYDLDKDYEQLCDFMKDIGFPSFGKSVDAIDKWLDEENNDLPPIGDLNTSSNFKDGGDDFTNPTGSHSSCSGGDEVSQ